MKKILIFILLASSCFGAWDAAKPSSSTSLRNSNPEILANWSALEVALSQDHTFATGSPDGKHTQITFTDPISTPTFAANEAFLYSKNVSAVTELHWLDESNNELQLTSGGDLFSSTGLTVTTNATFNGGITLGAGDDLLLSTTSDITISGNTFTVAGATGNTVVAGTLDVTGVATLGDGSLLAAATETADGDRTIVDLNYAKTGDTVQHDSEGGFSNCDINGTKTKVYTKYFTGTLDADDSTLVIHSLVRDNILHVSASVFDDVEAEFVTSENFRGSSVASSWNISYNNTHVVIDVVGTSIQGNAYRIKIDYKL